MDNELEYMYWLILSVDNELRCMFCLSLSMDNEGIHLLDSLSTADDRRRNRGRRGAMMILEVARR